jgi:hypothetical protein
MLKKISLIFYAILFFVPAACYGNLTIVQLKSFLHKGFPVYISKQLKADIQRTNKDGSYSWDELRIRANEEQMEHEHKTARQTVLSRSRSMTSTQPSVARPTQSLSSTMGAAKKRQPDLARLPIMSQVPQQDRADSSGRAVRPTLERQASSSPERYRGEIDSLYTTPTEKGDISYDRKQQAKGPYNTFSGSSTRSTTVHQPTPEQDKDSLMYSDRSRQSPISRTLTAQDLDSSGSTSRHQSTIYPASPFSLVSSDTSFSSASEPVDLGNPSRRKPIPTIQGELASRTEMKEAERPTVYYPTPNLVASSTGLTVRKRQTEIAGLPALTSHASLSPESEVVVAEVEQKFEALRQDLAAKTAEAERAQRELELERKTIQKLTRKTEELKLATKTQTDELEALRAQAVEATHERNALQAAQKTLAQDKQAAEKRQAELQAQLEVTTTKVSASGLQTAAQQAAFEEETQDLKAKLAEAQRAKSAIDAAQQNLARQLAEKNQEVQAAAARAQQFESQVAALREAQQKQARTLVEAQAALIQMQESLTQANQKTQAALEAARREKEAVEAAATAARTEAAATLEKLNAKSTELEVSRTSLAEANAAKTAAEQAKDTAQRELATLQQSSTASAEELRQAQERAAKAKQDAEAARAEAEGAATRLTAMQAELAHQKLQVEGADAEVAKLVEETNELKTAARDRVTRAKTGLSVASAESAVSIAPAATAAATSSAAASIPSRPVLSVSTSAIDIGLLAAPHGSPRSLDSSDSSDSPRSPDSAGSLAHRLDRQVAVPKRPHVYATNWEEIRIREQEKRAQLKKRAAKNKAGLARAKAEIAAAMEDSAAQPASHHLPEEAPTNGDGGEKPKDGGERWKKITKALNAQKAAAASPPAGEPSSPAGAHDAVGMFGENVRAAQGKKAKIPSSSGQVPGGLGAFGRSVQRAQRPTK